jgi:branched-chain amino acid transport system permease protein
LQNLAQFFFGARPRPVLIPFPSGSVAIGGISLSYTMLVTIAISVMSMIALNYTVHLTKLGKAMRAVSEDTEAAQLMGINVNIVITFTFAVGAALAGIGAVLYFVRFPIVNPTVGALLGLKAFIAAVLGGIGSIPGAMLGGFAIGFLEVLVTAAGLSRWTDGAVFLVLIIVLLFRPAGLMGKPMIEKV